MALIISPSSLLLRKDKHGIDSASVGGTGVGSVRANSCIEQTNGSKNDRSWT